MANEPFTPAQFDSIAKLEEEHGHAHGDKAALLRARLLYHAAVLQRRIDAAMEL